MIKEKTERSERGNIGKKKSDGNKSSVCCYLSRKSPCLEERAKRARVHTKLE